MHRAIIDGNTMETVWLRGRGARLVGTDYKGNQYWEKPAGDSIQNRIVIYKNVQACCSPGFHACMHACRFLRALGSCMCKPCAQTGHPRAV